MSAPTGAGPQPGAERSGEPCRADGGVVVVYEDRPANLVGVKLAVLSLGRHAPEMDVLVNVPGAPASFVRWTDAQPNAKLDRTSTDQTGWNVKASLLAHQLDLGRPWVVWLDSDVIVTGDLVARLRREPPDALVATEDMWSGRQQGVPSRTLAWGLQPGRVPRATVNTALVRVTPQHRVLLEVWASMLASDRYRDAQDRPLDQRPLHLWGDQEVLTALVASAGWRHVDVRLLRRGVDIAQCYDAGSFSPRERLRLGYRRGLPLLVHAMGAKPWAELGTTSGVDARLARWHNELGPYSWVAASYRDQLGEPAPWTEPSSRMGTGLSRLTRDDPVLRELPLSIVAATRALNQRVTGRLRRLREQRAARG